MKVLGIVVLVLSVLLVFGFLASRCGSEEATSAPITDVKDKD